MRQRTSLQYSQNEFTSCTIRPVRSRTARLCLHHSTLQRHPLFYIAYLWRHIAITRNQQRVRKPRSRFERRLHQGPIPGCPPFAVPEVQRKDLQPPPPNHIWATCPSSPHSPDVFLPQPTLLRKYTWHSTFFISTLCACSCHPSTLAPLHQVIHVQYPQDFITLSALIGEVLQGPATKNRSTKLL